jgi:hypothetical protein
MISMANSVAREVMHIEVTDKRIKKREVNLPKTLNKFYCEYIMQYEKNVGKGDSSFPSMPMRYVMYKTLSQYNSNDKGVEKRYRCVISMSCLDTNELESCPRPGIL